jgi:hypothetical protein
MIPNIPSDQRPSGALPLTVAAQGKALPVSPQGMPVPLPGSAEKLKLAAHLKNVTENYDQNLPFSKKKGVVSTLLYSFDKFIRKVSGKAPPLPFSEIELRFTMHLFRNFDGEALDLAYTSKPKVMKGLENQIPFSTVLKVWTHFFSSIPPLQKDVDVNALKKCCTYQKEIEEARLSFKWRRNSKIRRLSKNIGADMKKLNPGQKMYIPGGALTPGPNKSVEMHQMIYEVFRSEKESGQFVFKVINLSSQLHPEEAMASPVETYLVSEENLQEKMEVLLFAQTVPSPALDKLGPLEAYRLIKKGGNPLDTISSSGMTELQNVLKEFKRVASPDDTKEQLEEKIDPEKIYEVFQKALQGDSAKEHKLLLKTALFFHIYESSENRLSDPLWNKWMRDNAIQLLNSIETRVGAPDNEDLKVVEAKFQAILDALESAHSAGEKMPLPPSPQDQKEASVRFDESPLLFDKQLSMDKVKELKKADSETKTPIPPIDFLKVEPHAAYSQMKGQVDVIEKLSKTGQLESSREKLEDLFTMLQMADEADFFAKVPPQDAERWSGLINQMFHLEMQAHFGLNIQAPLPGMILNLLKSLEITQKLAHLRGKEGGFSGYALDMKPYKEMIKDPYLDLGSLGPKITQTIENIEKASDKRLRLTTVISRKMSSVEQDFYKEFIRDHPHLKIPPDRFLGLDITEGISSHLSGDFGEEHLLPAQVVHLKQAALMSQMMMGRYRTLHLAGVGRAFGEIVKTGISASKELKKGGKLSEAETQEIVNAVAWRRQQKNIDKHLTGSSKQAGFRVTQDITAGGRSIKVEPYGVNFHDFGGPVAWETGDARGEKAPIFASTGEAVANQEIRSNVVEGQLLGGKDEFSYQPSGKTQYERGVIEEKSSLANLPLDVSAELQLMQSGTIGTRIPLTLGFFMNHPALLTDAKIGIDMQRVFKLNLFRNNALGLKLETEPEYAEAFVRDLERLMRGMEASQNVRGSLFLMEVFEEARGVLPALNDPCDRNFSRLQYMLDNAGSHKKEIYQAVLLHYHHQPKEKLTEQDFANIIKSYLLYRQMPQTARERNNTKENSINHLMRSLPAHLERFLENGEERDKVLSQVFGQERHFDPSPRYPLYQSGNVEIDILRGRIYEDHVAQSFLPQKIVQDPACVGLFGMEELFNIRAKQKDVKGGDEVGEQYEFKSGQKIYRILSFPTKGPLIYRLEGQKWYQFQNPIPLSEAGSLKESKQGDSNVLLSLFRGTYFKKLEKSLMESLNEGDRGNLPQGMLEMPCWVAPEGVHFQIEDRESKVCFEGVLSSHVPDKHQKTAKEKGKAVRVLKEIRDVERKTEVLNPWKEPKFHLFQALDSQNQVVCTGSQGKVDRVYYPRHQLEYQWKEDQWQCLNFDGYSLSDKPVEGFFASYFKDYHLLEHPSKQDRLLISGDKYEPEKVKGVTSHLLKHRRVPAKKIPSDVNSAPPLYSFDVDPVQGLKSETKEGYLYLAYVLYTQKRYAQSVFYLRKAADIKLGVGEADLVINWFKGWKDPSIESSAVQLHLQSILSEQKMAAGKSGSLTEIATPELLAHLQKYMSGKVDPALDLSERQKRAIGMLLQADKSPYEKQIKENSKVLQKTSPQEFPEYSKDLFIDTLGEFLTNRPPANPEEIRSWEMRIGELKKAFHIGQKVAEEEAFKQELGEELIGDLESAITQGQLQSAVLKGDVDLKKLVQATQSKRDEYLIESAKHQAAILNLMTFPELKEGFIGIARQLEHYDELKNRYFEEALYCAAAGDFSPLIEVGVIQEGQEASLASLAEDFLVQATAAAQYQKAADFAETLQKGASEAVLTQFNELLNTERHFDPKKDPHRLPILLMEHFTRNIAFKSQVQNVRDMLTDKNVFKHEALAGGKTTMLRNIISKIKADGVTLSGVMTHEPLFGMHHPLYEKTTREAYGEKAWKLSFTRNDPSDVKALNLIHTNMLKAIAERGRISTTRSDVLSLRNIFLQKYDELWKGKGDPEVKNGEIDALSSILELLMDHTSIGNDELEKILAPDNENNYTSGDEKGSLNEVKSSAALELTEWILEDTLYKPIFQSNQHSKMTDGEARQFRVDLAKQVHDKYLPGTDIKQCTQYLIGEGSYAEQLKFYQDHVANHPQHKEVLSAFHKFLSEVVKGSFLREGGDGYKRSEGGIEVKPACDGKVNPRSEFGTEEETIWYTCLNYMDISQGGVTSEQMGRIVGKYQDQAFQEIILSFKNDPSFAVDVTKTKAFQDFRAQFGLNLLEVAPEDWGKMGEKVNKDPKKLVGLLRKDILPQYVVSPEKIAANSQDLTTVLDEIYGSAGTSNNWRALPDSIKKDQLHLLKQKGVDGAVLARLYQTYVPGDIIARDQTLSLEEQVGALLKANKGSSLIDLGPFFPGKSSLAIGESLLSHLPKGQAVRMLDESDEVVIRRAGSKEALRSIPNEEMITIYGKANCRGTNLVSGNDSVGFVTIGPQTTATDCLQAVMRMRKLGKGQKVKYLLDPAVQKRLGLKPNLGDLIAFLEGNEAETLKNRSHLKAEKQKIPAIAKGNLFRELVKTKDRDLRGAAKNLRPFFFKPSQESLESCGIPKEEKRTSGVVTEMAKSEKKKLEGLLVVYQNLQLPQANQEQLQGTIKSIQTAIGKLDKKIAGENRIPDKYLPKVTLDSPSDLDIEQEQEKEQEQEIEAEKEQEQEVQAGGGKRDYQQIPLMITTREEFIDQILKDRARGEVKPLCETVKFYDSQLFATKNFLQGDAPWGAEDVKGRVRGQNRVLRSTFIVDQRKDPAEVYTVFGNIKDHDISLGKLDAKDAGSDQIDVYHMNMQTGNFDGRLTQMKNYPAAIQEKIARSLVQAKFFAGEVDLVKPMTGTASIIRNESAAFKKWLGGLDKDQVVLMEINLKKYLQEYKPSVYAEYHKSEMARLFRKDPSHIDARL